MLVGSFRYLRNQPKLPRSLAGPIVHVGKPQRSAPIPPIPLRCWRHSDTPDNLFYHQYRYQPLDIPSTIDNSDRGLDLPRAARDLADCAALYLARLSSPHSRRAYAADVRDFLRWSRGGGPELREIGPLHIQQWQLHLQSRGASPATQRRKLSALSTLFRALCSDQLLASNPVASVHRPRVDSYEGKTPALSDAQVRSLLAAPNPRTPKGQRDRAILALLAYQGLRRGELCALNIGDLHMDRGEWRLSVRGKGGKRRSLPLHPAALTALRAYLKGRDHPSKLEPMFTAHSNGRGDGRLSGQGVYTSIVRHYGAQLGLTELIGFGPHVLRTTVATHALENGVDLAVLQSWMGHASVQTTRAYDRRSHSSRPQRIPVSY